MARLRGKADALRKQVKGLEQIAQARTWKPSETASRSDPRSDSSASRSVISDSTSEEYKVQLYKLACAARPSSSANGSPMRDARNLSRAVRFYARERQGQLPSNFNQASDYYSQGEPAPETDGFEFAFQGSLTDLTNIPSQAVVLLREKEAWQTPNGKWARIYVMAGGEVKVVESEDNFQSWEGEHVVPPP